uniref:RNA helicase n=1 Tax=Romanomermis culicivorax TaxID=13658 RepID=A0A915JI16_ROMCU
MLDMGFESEMRRLLEHNTLPLKSERQTLMFSATFPEEIQRLAQDFLRPQFAFIAVGIVGGANTDITQVFEQVDKYGKKERLVALLKEDLENSLPDESGRYRKKTLVFVERKRVADFTASFLSQMEFMATSIHGDREQQQREEALGQFKCGKCPILIATAVAARGLDIVGVDHVINYDLPNSIEDYVHRIGRTGRVGNPGRATSFFDSSVDTPLATQLVQILSDAQQVVPDWLQSYTTGVQSMSTERAMFGGRD